MEKSEYEMMYNVEDDYWWYRGLHDLTLKTVKNLCTSNGSAINIKILDAGCGTGALLQRLKALNNHSFGFDIAQEANRFCQLRGLHLISQASITDIPFESNTFKSVISMDVICTLSEKEIAQAFEEIYRVLDKGGVFIFNLPTYNFLKSTHDRAVDIQKRFVRHALKKQLESLHFFVHYLTYRNTVLFPALALVRLVKKIGTRDNPTMRSDVSPLPSWINTLLTHILLAENHLLLRGVRFPFGLSLFGVVQK